MTKFAKRFESLRASTIQTSTKTRPRPKKNLSRLMRPMRFWAIRRSERSTMSSGRIGTRAADFNHHRDGRHNNRVEDSTAPEVGMEVSSSNLEGPDSAISLKPFLGADEDAVVLAEA